MTIAHLRFAFRLFQKEGAYSVLNILGLSLGICIGIILLLYLQSELSYDKHWAKHDQIYRFTNHLKADGADFNTARSARELGPIFRDEFPEVLEYVRFLGSSRLLIEVENEGGVPDKFYESHSWITDSSFFNVFDHKFIEGSPENALSGPGKVVITESVAKKYYGDKRALGRILHFPEGDVREISAVISDVPDNTHLKYTVLRSPIESRQWFVDADDVGKSEAFWNPNAFTYMLLPKEYDASQFYSKFPAIFDKTFGLFSEQINGTVKPNLQPIADIHFNSDKYDDEPTGNLNYVYTFAAVGVFIIILACINYMNMSTARSVTRTGEMGIRKVLGYSRSALFRTVIFEALLMAFLAMVLALTLAFIVLEWTGFNDLLNRNLSLDLIGNPSLIIGTIGITLIVGLLSGIYPALYIPSFPVVQALKGTFTADKRGSLLRKSLIVFQFMISLFVIICTVLMDNQITFLSNKNIGLDKENIILIDIRDSTIENNMDAIITELKRDPAILEVSTGYGTPGFWVGGQVMWVEKDSALVQQSMNIIWAGENYLKTLGIEVIEGRGFRENSESDYENAFLVNETGAREFGWTGEPIGKKAKYYHGEDIKRTIGVVRDFNFESLHNPVSPLFIIPNRSDGGWLHVKLSSMDLENALEHIETTWTRFDTKHPFEYYWLDQEFAKNYKAEMTQQKLISWLSYVCIFISILGLVGLSAFTASKRAKEISIRKVLGAGVSSILFLFARGYVKLILIAFVISIPLANYLMVEWLSDFSYRVSLHWLNFVIPGILVMAMALITIAAQLIRSAKADPVKGLRSE